MVTEPYWNGLQWNGTRLSFIGQKARKLAQQYYMRYGEPIPTSQLVQRVAYIMQEYTQSGGVRPFGVSFLIAGWDS
ncbi:Proteasome subunit alpha type-2 like protein [Argiope bruennichi]|uniref:Proteasome subunit alpha type-2 like protein n=1 Tax=Argiope bruennichi TaxID=94029 RepID=A0A8T0EZT1_ARGBR|nr:Proteasome subunit alpha type-2 like protein [Argiope bruennichi]